MWWLIEWAQGLWALPWIWWRIVVGKRRRRNKNKRDKQRQVKRTKVSMFKCSECKERRVIQDGERCIRCIYKTGEGKFQQSTPASNLYELCITCKAVHTSMADGVCLVCRGKDGTEYTIGARGTYQRCSHQATELQIADFKVWVGGEYHITNEQLTQCDVMIPLSSAVVPSDPYGWGFKGIVLAFPTLDHNTWPKWAVKWICGEIAKYARAGRKVLFFCMGGHGRTGTILASLLAIYTETDDPIGDARKLYCKEAVEAVSQLETIYGILGKPAPEGMRESLEIGYFASTDYATRGITKEAGYEGDVTSTADQIVRSMAGSIRQTVAEEDMPTINEVRTKMPEEYRTTLVHAILNAPNGVIKPGYTQGFYWFFGDQSTPGSLSRNCFVFTYRAQETIGGREYDDFTVTAEYQSVLDDTSGPRDITGQTAEPVQQATSEEESHPYYHRRSVDDNKLQDWCDLCAKIVGPNAVMRDMGQGDVFLLCKLCDQTYTEEHNSGEDTKAVPAAPREDLEGPSYDVDLEPDSGEQSTTGSSGGESTWAGPHDTVEPPSAASSSLHD